MICDLDTKMWSDPWFESLKPNAKLLFIYLWTNNHKNLPCLYEITISTISNETGFTRSEVRKLLKILHPKVKYSEPDNMIWVVNSVRRQFLKYNKISDKIVKGIKNALLQLPEGHFLIGEFLNKYKVLCISYTYPIQSSGYLPGEEEGVGKGVGEGKALNANVRFQKPTLEEIQDYCQERENSIKPQAFIDHYTSNGWRVGGKAPMKDWKAAVRTWEQREKDKPKERKFI